MSDLLQKLYLAAANAGLLKTCTWYPSDGSPPRSNQVGFAAPDETLLEGLGSGRDYMISYPATIFEGLAPPEAVEIDKVVFQLRECRAVGDGSEIRARLTRL